MFIRHNVKAVMLVAIFTCISNPVWATQLTVTGHASMKIPPDQALITLQVVAEQPTANQAKQQVDDKITRIRQGLSKWLKDDAMTNDELRIHPFYHTERPSADRQLAGYQASRAMQLKLKDLAHLSAILDMALHQGADAIADIRYQNSQWESWGQKVRIQAVHNGQELATQFASALGKKVVDVTSVEYQGGYVSHPPVLLRSMKLNTPMAAANYQRQDLTIDDSVLMKFELK
ncbi:SIMPL domain-containing protein [Celerinatantimonas sp. YJH-8]|uniref:SIMPL domain-containing protein n=1 Tax=Celerinatantimonas sp. YJH-8 TaxID=3228714 RepID=UPI0038BF847D